MMQTSVCKSLTPLVLPLIHESVPEETRSCLLASLKASESHPYKLTIRYEAGSLSRAVDDFTIRLTPPDNPSGTRIDESIGSENGVNYEQWLLKLLHTVPCKGIGDEAVAALLVVNAHNAQEQVLELCRNQDLARSAPILRYVWIVEDTTAESLEASSSSIGSDSKALDAVKGLVGVHCASVEVADETKVREAIREMLSSSVIPFMEQCVGSWQHPTDAKHQSVQNSNNNNNGGGGFGSKLLNMSKRLVLSAASQSAINNYCPPLPQKDIVGGILTSIQRGLPSDPGVPGTGPIQAFRLATFALLLRDFKLAHAAFEVLRRDHASNLGWPQLAAVQELMAVASLLNTAPGFPRPTAKQLEPIIDAAIFTYLSRCDLPLHALRCCLVVSELLSIRVPADSAIGARWLAKVLEVPALAPGTIPIVMDRISFEYKAKSWNRKAALWEKAASLARSRPLEVQNLTASS